MKVSEAAAKWGLSRQRVLVLLGEGRVRGARYIIDPETRRARWEIPKGAKKPQERKRGRPRGDD